MFSRFTTLFFGFVKSTFRFIQSFLWLPCILVVCFLTRDSLSSIKLTFLVHEVFSSDYTSFHGLRLSILTIQHLSTRLPNIFHRLRFSFLVYKSLFIRLPDVFRVLQYSFWVWKISSSVYQIFITICNFLFTISESPPRCTNYLQ